MPVAPGAVALLMMGMARSLVAALIRLALFGPVLAAGWFGLLFGADFVAGAAAGGGVGWVAGLILRAPAALLLQRTKRQPLQAWVASASGPIEEGLRLVAVVFVATSLGSVYSVGLGWAGAEILYLIASGLAADELRQSKAGRVATELFQPISGWAFLERTSAVTTHVGFTLLIWRWPISVIATAICHSAINLLAIRLSRRSIGVAEIAIAGIAFCVGVAGLLAALRFI